MSHFFFVASPSSRVTYPAANDGVVPSVVEQMRSEPRFIRSCIGKGVSDFAHPLLLPGPDTGPGRHQ